MRSNDLLLLLLLICCGFRSSEPATGSLVIEVSNIRSGEGVLWIGVYDSASTFMVKEKAIVEGYNIERPGTLQLHLPALPFGTYAIALFHDENCNGEMDRNFVGIPSEPYAFSQPPKSKWRLPKFEEVQFSFHRDHQVLHTRLEKWWD